MPTAEKLQKIDEIKSLFEGHENVILTEYRGLTVSEISALRRDLSQEGTSYRVLKNTLVKRATEALGLNDLSVHLQGPTAIAFVHGEMTSAAKKLDTFAKGNPALVIKAGLLAGKVIDETQVKAIASLPSREQLVAMLLGVLNNPVTGLVRVLSGPSRALVTVLDQIAKDKGVAA